MTQRRLPTLLAASALAAMLLSGCTSSGGASDGGAWTEYAVEVDSPDAASGDAADADRALVVTGAVTMTVDDPVEAANEARDLVVSAGGRVDAREQSAPRDGRSGTARLQLRIPADELEGVLDRLGDLGRIDDTSTQAVDVGTQQRDIDTRITTLRASIARYTTWLASAQTTSDLIELEGAISQRQTELEALEAQQRALADQVAFSTIDLHLYSDATSPVATGPSDFGSAFVVGWQAFVTFWIGTTVVLGVLLPWLLMLGAIGAVVMVIVRARRRRDAAGPSTEPSSSTPA